MSAYAVLGATGSTGGSILRVLNATPTNKIHALVRSRSKLEKLHPSSTSNPNITVFEGSISNADNLARCLTGVKAAFLCVAASDNIPDCTIAQDTAHAVVSALQGLRKRDANFKPPRLIVLSSASLDDKFWVGIPSLVHKMLFAAMYYVYTDLQKAEAFLSQHEDWLTITHVMPGGISHDVQRGHKLSATEQQTFISFLDVAAGMVEAADDERWDGMHVCVVGSSGQKARLPWEAPVVLGKGLFVYCFPWMYKYIPS
jgi:putative NADH-flavin reductase